MKPFLQNIFTKTAILLVFVACVATSCDPEPPTPTNPLILNRPPKPDEYPKDIAFTEYSLDSTSCKWISNIPHARCGAEYNYLIIINSNEELEKHITCESDSYPVIDFSKHTLLLACGARCHYDNLISIDLQQFSRQNYVMTVVFQVTPRTAAKPWQIPIIVNKLRTGCTVELVEENYKP